MSDKDETTIVKLSPEDSCVIFKADGTVEGLLGGRMKYDSEINPSAFSAASVMCLFSGHEDELKRLVLERLVENLEDQREEG